MDLNLRRLRYFVTTAEELSFGRAAQKLHVAQPVLSRQIAILEKELGVTLLHRSPRGTALTSAGTALLDEARTLLDHATRLQRHARLAARGQTHLTLGFMPGITVTAVVSRLRDAFPDLTVDVVRTRWEDQTEMVHDGRVDASFVRLPVSPDGLTVVALDEEPRLVALARDHPLTRNDSITMADIALLDLLQPPESHPDWRDAALAVRPDALTAARDDLPVVHTVEEKLEQVAQGRGIILLPESAAAYYNRPDVVYRYVTGLAPVRTALAYDRSRASAPLEQLVRIAVAHHASGGPAPARPGTARPAGSYEGT